jgi:hypothetical protein
MRIKQQLIHNTMWGLFFWLVISQASATLYCNRTYSELTVNPGRPYNAVGYINNGCTAFLIDANHIVTSAHCFVNPVTGAWQSGLRFYPNFHPDRVTTDPNRVPRGDITDVVVGSRAGESVLGVGMSWGIARIENWRDTSSLNMTPVALAIDMPALGTALENPAYTRHHFPYDDNDAVVWDNMDWDDTVRCNWVGESRPGARDGGIWAINVQPAPFHQAGQREVVDCNARWAAGMHHRNCALKKQADDIVTHNCDTIGGSSGSPILYRTPKGRWRAIAVAHGGGDDAVTYSSNHFEQHIPGPTCSADTSANHDNVGASVVRFRMAPHYAANVAIHRRPDNAAATAVFVVDSDKGRIVYRARSGTPEYEGKFSYWKSLGVPRPRAKLSSIAACSADASGKPQVFVIADNSRIYSRHVAANGKWSSKWSNIGIPANVGGVLDIDTAHDNNGRCQLFIVSGNGNVYLRAKTTDNNWRPWQRIVLGHTGNASGSFARISALKYEKIIWVTLLDKIGQLWRSRETAQGWTDPVQLNKAPGVNAWRDIDMTWDEAGRGFMLATPDNGGNRLWFLPMYGSKAWFGWRYFDTHLWAPAATTPQDAPKILSLTASRWMEDKAGITSPVVFATGEKGNVYFIEYTRVVTPRWILDWKSFYHEKILYK